MKVFYPQGWANCRTVAQMCDTWPQKCEGLIAEVLLSIPVFKWGLYLFLKPEIFKFKVLVVGAPRPQLCATAFTDLPTPG